MTSPLPARVARLVVALLILATVAAAAPPEFGDGLILPPVARGTRSPVSIDPVTALLVHGAWVPPMDGDTLQFGNGRDLTWRTLAPAAPGVYESRAFAGGSLFLPVESDRDRVVMLEASGHTLVTVNGEPRVGDPYGTNDIRLPVRLRAGLNEFLFVGRGSRLTARLVEPEAPVTISPLDRTVPHVIRGEAIDTLGAVNVINATDAWLGPVGITCRVESAPTGPIEWTSIPPLTSRKIAFRIVGPPPGPADRVATELRLVNERGDVLATLEDSLGARRADERHSRTFRSEIDGSVQYYAVVPASPGDGSTAPGIVLSLHGASVQAARQAACYEARPWAHLVAPTNRRPFGFDWEDWGRLDAIEVLDLNQARLGTDPDRTWLTGHSMGGHGTWHLGVTYPDRFAAIAPSAGWISFRSYTGAARFDDADAVEAMMARATTPSDTMSLTPNLVGRGVYVLHGDADDNVPVSEARTMRSHLATFHTDFAYYERPGAGHWWGKRCVDWPPLMSFLEAHAVDTSTAARAVSFVTANPGVSSRRRWVEVIGQKRTGVLSRVDLTWDPETRRIAGSTVNVSRLRFDVGAFEAGAAPTIELDGAPVPDAPERDASSQVWLERRDGAWRRTDEPSRAHKGPHRNGGFKDAFRHRVMLVYGTQGTDEENAWAIAKARYDAETFWMRGNGSFDIVRDIDFDAETTVNRNVILYGNADTNAAWNDVLDLSGFTLRRGILRLGAHEMTDDDLACLVIRPRRGSDVASVGIVGGTGIVGLRLTDRLPYFVSGVGYPDVTILSPDVLEHGMKGIVAAGYFAEDWSVERGDWAMRAD